jgi:hypothetical protein
VSEIHRLRLSDTAHKGLKLMARSAGYGQVAPFLMACAHARLAWYDARTDALRDSTGADETAVWYDQSPRFQRVFGALPVTYLITVAQSHGIRSHARQSLSISGADPAKNLLRTARRDSEWQLLTSTLEAMGLGYLKPASTPPNNSHGKSGKYPLDKVPVIM